MSHQYGKTLLNGAAGVGVWVTVIGFDKYEKTTPKTDRADNHDIASSNGRQMPQSRVLQERTPPPSRETKKPRTKNRSGPGGGSSSAGMEERFKALVYRIHLEMTTEQVEEILGAPDEIEKKDLGDFDPEKSGKTHEILTWKGATESDSSIILSFVNHRLQDGGTTGYDIRKGFISK
jgi:hypothetical protein